MILTWTLAVFVGLFGLGCFLNVADARFLSQDRFFGFPEHAFQQALLFLVSLEYVFMVCGFGGVLFLWTWKQITIAWTKVS